MKKKISLQGQFPFRIMLFFVGLLSIAIPSDGQPIRVHLDKAGTLQQTIKGKENSISELAIVGPINGSDLRLLRMMAGRIDNQKSSGFKLSKLDLSDAKIVYGGEEYIRGLKTEDNSLGQHSFTDCDNLKDIVLPTNLYLVSAGFLSDCDSLKNITISSINRSYKTLDGVLYSKDGKVIIQYPAGKKSEAFTLPTNVLYIKEYAFKSCTNIKSISIPNTVEDIGQCAFINCSELTSLVLPNNITDIKYRTFYNCFKLEEIRIPNNVKYIHEEAFSNCFKLKYIFIPRSTLSIDQMAFFDCIGLESVEVEKGNPNYTSEQGVLMELNPRSIQIYPGRKRDFTYEIPSYITTIRKFAFSDNLWIQAVKIPNSIVEIEDMAFCFCKNLGNIHYLKITMETMNRISIGCDNLTPSRKSIRYGQGIYSGPTVNGTPHGKGEIVWYNGSMYKGDFVNGAITGYGYLKEPTGRSYKGNFKNGYKDGFGVDVDAVGDYIEGNFNKNELHGHAKLFSRNNELVFEGIYENGKLKQKIEKTNLQDQITNTGSYKRIPYAQGMYTGPTIDGVPHGFGEIVWEDGSSFSGNFINGKIIGKGFHRMSNNMIYEGDFDNGYRHGQGVLMDADGNFIKGSFQKNEIHGSAMVYNKNNEFVLEGVWENGKLIKKIEKPNSQIQLNSEQAGFLTLLVGVSVAAIANAINKEYIEPSKEEYSQRTSSQNTTNNNQSRTYSSSSSQASYNSSNNSSSLKKVTSASECCEISELQDGGSDLFGKVFDDYYYITCKSNGAHAAKLYISNDGGSEPYYINGIFSSIFGATTRFSTFADALKYIGNNRCDCYIK